MHKLLFFCLFITLSPIDVSSQNTFTREFNTVHHINDKDEVSTLHTNTKIIFNAGSSNNVTIKIKDKDDINLFQTTVVENSSDEYGSFQRVGYAEVGGDGNYYLLLYDDGAVFLKNRDVKESYMFVNE